MRYFLCRVPRACPATREATKRRSIVSLINASPQSPQDSQCRVAHGLHLAHRSSPIGRLPDNRLFLLLICVPPR